MLEGLNWAELYNQVTQQLTPLAVFLAVFSFIYAALGRSKMFHFERGARLVLSLVLSLYSANLVLLNGWGQIITVTATAVGIGLVALIMYHVGLQRGKTKEESVDVIDE